MPSLSLSLSLSLSYLFSSSSRSRYSWDDHQIHAYADDVVPRYITSHAILDYCTVAGGDKFGNVFVCQLSDKASQAVEDDPTGGRALSGKGEGCAYKLELACHFHLGDTVTAIQRAAMQPGGKEVLLYATVQGELGALVPVTSREDVDFLTALEMQLRQVHAPLCGRDHLSYRSSYVPVRNVIDGCLCEQFSQLSGDAQRKVGDEIERSPGEIMKKLEDMRNRIL